MAKQANLRPVLRASGTWRAVTRAQINRFRLRDVRPLPAMHAGEIFDGSLWLEVHLDARWKAAYRIQQQQERFVIAELRIVPIEAGAMPGEWSGAAVGPRASAPPGGIPSAVYGDLRSRETIRVVSDIVNRLQARYREAAAKVILQDTLPQKRGRGRPPAKPVTFYRQFAKRYVVVEADRATRSTRQTLAREYHTDEAVVARWIRRCRSLGILTPTKTGKRGGELVVDPSLQRIATEVGTRGVKAAQRPSATNKKPRQSTRGTGGA